jgi:hypothetical protein
VVDSLSDRKDFIMTPQELAALPKGTRIKLDLKPDIGFDYGTIVQTGAVCHIKWEPEIDGTEGPTSIIHTEAQKWGLFISDTSLAAD